MKYNQFMEKTLKQKVAKGTFWVFSSQITTQIFAFIKNIIIARILSPDDFGLFGIALIVLSLFDVFTQTGFNAALIQKKEDIKDYLDTAFVVNIIRGFILFILLYLAAPYVSVFFKNTLVTPIVRVISLTFLINGFINPGTIYFTKELDFKRQFYWDMSRTITDIVVSLSIVFFLRNVWVLVISAVSSSFIRLIVSYFIHPYKPKLRFNKRYAGSLFRFGKWIFASGILIYLITQGDDALVGKVLGITMLGFYRMAYRFSNMPATQITHVISRVTFPAYSKLQGDIPRLREAYLQVLQVTAFLVFPFAGLIFVLAPDFTRIFLGEKWMPMVPAMQALSIFGVTRAMNATVGSIFQGMGKPSIITFGAVFQLIILAAIIYPLTIRWGILGTSIAVIIPNLLVMFYLSKKLINSMHYKSSNILNLLFPPIVGSAVMCTVIFFFLIWTHGNLIGFLLSIFIGIGIYLIIVYKIDKTFNYGLKSNLIQLLKEQGREEA